MGKSNSNLILDDDGQLVLKSSKGIVTINYDDVEKTLVISTQDSDSGIHLDVNNFTISGKQSVKDAIIIGEGEGALRFWHDNTNGNAKIHIEPYYLGSWNEDKEYVFDANLGEWTLNGNILRAAEVYYVDHNVTDQGSTDIGSFRSIVEALDESSNATIIFSSPDGPALFTFDTTFNCSAWTNLTFEWQRGATFVQKDGDEVVIFNSSFQLQGVERRCIAPIDMLIFNQDIMRYPEVQVFPWVSPDISNVRAPSGLWLDVSSSTTQGLQEAITYAFGDGTPGSANYNLDICGRQEENGGAFVFTISDTLYVPPIRGAVWNTGSITIFTSGLVSPLIEFDSFSRCEFNLNMELYGGVPDQPLVRFRPHSTPPGGGTPSIGDSRVSITGVGKTVDSISASPEYANVVIDCSEGYFGPVDLFIQEINGHNQPNAIGFAIINATNYWAFNSKFSLPQVQACGTTAIQVGNSDGANEYIVNNMFHVGTYGYDYGVGIDCYALRNHFVMHSFFDYEGNYTIKHDTDVIWRSSAENNLMTCPFIVNVIDESNGSNRIITSTSDTFVSKIALGFDWQDPVKDQISFVTSEPVSPTTGDRYINTATGMSSETGQSVTVSHIYEWNGVNWSETEPNGRSAVWVEDEDVLYTFNGTIWIKFGSAVVHNNLSDLQGGVTNEYYHLTAAQHNGLINTGDSALHYHSADRDRMNHTGSQTATTISDFDTEVSNNVDVSANTMHRSSDGKDHSDVVLNSTHRTSTGSDHTYIDQSVVSGSSPTFSGSNFTGIPTSGLSDGTNIVSLIDNSMANTLHRHSELSASDGSPDAALSVDVDGKVFLSSGTGINEFSTDMTFADDSDDAIPTEHAVKAYIPTQVTFENLAANGDIGSGMNQVSSGNHTHSFSNTVAVAKSGAAFTSIQDAIDSITDASSTNRYIVLVYAGVYEENIVMKNYVNIIGVNSRRAAKITASSGTLITLPNIEAHINWIDLEMTASSSADIVIDATAGAGSTGFYRIENSDITMSSAVNGITPKIVDADCGIGIYFINDTISYTMTGTAATGMHTPIYLKNNNKLLYLLRSIARGTINCSSASLTTINDNSAGRFYAQITTLEATFTNDSNAGICTVFASYGSGGSALKQVDASVINVTGTGAGTGYVSYVDSFTDNVMMEMSRNIYDVHGFTNNRRYYTGLEDIINSYFNKERSLLTDAGTGTINRVDIDQNMHFGFSTGAFINEFSTDGTFTGNSDLAVPTEKASKTYVDTHATSSGSSHTYINQSVTSSASPTFTGLTINGNISTRKVASSVVADTDFDMGEILSTGITSGYGLMIVKETVDKVTGLFRIENTTIVNVSSNTAFGTIKDTGSKYNVYWETDQFKIQNRVGSNKSISVALFVA